MNVIVGQKEKNLAVVKEFAQTDYWLQGHAGFYTDNFTLEFPFAPPGWLQTLNIGETRAHFEWLRRTVKNWEWKNLRVYSTNFHDKFWIKRDGAGDVFWAGKDGRFESRFVTLITVEDGKISRIKDHFDALAVYKAIGVTLPVFTYDAPDPAFLPRRKPVPDISGDPEKLVEKTKATLARFVAVDFWDDEQINANEIVHELPFAPPDMPKRYEANEYDALNVWISTNCLEWHTYAGNTLYETDEPGTYFIESGGAGFMSWAGVKGHYQQRELSYLCIENGYAREFHEYFNPINKFNSINVSVPTFPYLF
jgi:ketosteroid isomerase-like protein